LRFDISDLLLVEDQQTANRSLCQCPNFGGQLKGHPECGLEPSGADSEYDTANA